MHPSKPGNHIYASFRTKRTHLYVLPGQETFLTINLLRLFDFQTFSESPRFRRRPSPPMRNHTPMPMKSMPNHKNPSQITKIQAKSTKSMPNHYNHTRNTNIATRITKIHPKASKSIVQIIKIQAKSPESTPNHTNPSQITKIHAKSPKSTPNHKNPRQITKTTPETQKSQPESPKSTLKHPNPW